MVSSFSSDSILFIDFPRACLLVSGMSNTLIEKTLPFAEKHKLHHAYGHILAVLLYHPL